MATSREIKSALTKAFKGVKFSVTTRNVCCETVTVEWTGGPFIDEVKTITNEWNTFEDHSDIMSDFHSYRGTEIKFERNLTHDEMEFLAVGILELHGKFVDGTEIEFIVEQEWFREIGDEYFYNDLTRDHNQALRDWKQNGLAVSLDESPQVIEAEKIEIVEDETELIQGDYTEGMVNGIIKCIELNWHEGISVVENCAKFATFKSFHEAVLKVCDINNEDFANYQGCYTKLKFTIHYVNGSSEWGRLDLCLVEDNPYKTDNIIKSHWADSTEYQQLEDVTNYSKNNNDAIAAEWLLDDDHRENVLMIAKTEQVESVELHTMFTDSATAKINESKEPLLEKYSQWVAKKIALGQANKIIAFDDWQDIHTA